MDKKYQVFVSSTFTDLEEERKAIINSLLDAGYIPAGMEMFNAADDEQFKYIKKIIDYCDYYILIIAGRYGSVNPETCISYTEQEYDYAKAKGIPVLVFVYDKPFDLPFAKRDDENREKFVGFRNKAMKGKMCRVWSDKTQLVSSVLTGLYEFIKSNPGIGWVRGSNHLNYNSTGIRNEDGSLVQEVLIIEEESEISEHYTKAFYDLLKIPITLSYNLEANEKNNQILSYKVFTNFFNIINQIDLNQTVEIHELKVDEELIDIILCADIVRGTDFHEFIKKYGSCHIENCEIEYVLFMLEELTLFSEKLQGYYNITDFGVEVVKIIRNECDEMGVTQQKSIGKKVK